MKRGHNMKKEKIFKYAKEHFGSDPEYLWENTPDCCILRNKSNRKRYAVLMKVEKEKLGLPGNEKTYILNVKCNPIMIGSFTSQKGFLPAYHMNKEHWISIIIESAKDSQIFDMLHGSFDLINKKAKTKKQPF